MDIKTVTDIPSLDRYLAEREAAGLWKRMGGARVEFKPYLWKWGDLYEGVMKLCELAAGDPGFGQRLQGKKRIRLVNPSLGDKETQTTQLSVRALTSGEHLGPHRHSEATLCFILKGDARAFSVVDGEAMPMREGDIITIPSWVWHDAYHEGSEPVFWLEASDSLIAERAGRFFEPGGSAQAVATKPHDYSARVSGPARPSWIKAETSATPCRYPKEETCATLQALKESRLKADPHDGLRLIYTDPQTRGPTFATLSGEVHLLPSGHKTQAHRHNSTGVYHVIGGSGVTVVANERYEWARGDIFVIPPWFSHYHESAHAEDATLLCITDRPTLTALGFYREEATP